MRGTIFELKRFAVHDGPGIRSTLFVKGCPLHCPWCQNPEGMRRAVELWRAQADCVGCGGCAAACPEGAIDAGNALRIDRSRCTRCGRCVELCPAAALSMDGREIEAREAVELLLRDLPFYEGGGVTLSGGEVFAQWEFCLEVLRLCRERGADTAIESCLYTDAEILRLFLPVVDHFIMDVKYLDPQEHRRVLGVDNAPILRNFEYLVSSGADVLVRTPLIPGYTASEANIRAIARYLASVKPDIRYELLNFNPLCRSKYAALDRDYPVEGGALRAEEMDAFYAILRSEGIRNIVRE